MSNRPPSLEDNVGKPHQYVDHGLVITRDIYMFVKSVFQKERYT